MFTDQKNIIMLAILPKPTYRFSVISINNQSQLTFIEAHVESQEESKQSYKSMDVYFNF